jgi:hypothetical protein
MQTELLQYFLPPAIIIAITVFLVKFFGKVMSDQVPFADDRKWHEELSGITFFTNYILSPTIWVLIIYSRGWNFWLFHKEDIWLFIISLVTVVGLNLVVKQSLKFFVDNDFEDGDVHEFFKKSFSTKDQANLSQGDWMVIIKHLIHRLLSIFILVMIIFFYKWETYYHLIVAILYLFIHLVGYALILSLKKRNILLADIYFINKKEGRIKDCRVLKINNDNVKISTGEKIVIINKSLISRIEFIKKKEL